MKYFLLSLLIVLNSCASIKYDVKRDKNNFSKIKEGTSYVFWAEKDFRKRLYVTNISADSIEGINKKSTYALNKNEIQKVRKNNTAQTIIVSYFASGVVLFLIGISLFKISPIRSDY